MFVDYSQINLDFIAKNFERYHQILVEPTLPFFILLSDVLNVPLDDIQLFLNNELEAPPKALECLKEKLIKSVTGLSIYVNQIIEDAKKLAESC